MEPRFPRAFCTSRAWFGGSISYSGTGDRLDYTLSVEDDAGAAALAGRC